MAIIAIDCLSKLDRSFSILDIGCGYGRDAIYFSKHLECAVYSIDSSKEVVDIATSSKTSNIKFECCDFTHLDSRKYDIVFTSNLYHFFRKQEREKFIEMVKRVLKPEELFFLSTLSIEDTQDYTALPETASSRKPYVHLSTRDELMEEFNFLRIKELYEYEYYKPHYSGEIHHHILLILIGENTG